MTDPVTYWLLNGTWRESLRGVRQFIVDDADTVTMKIKDHPPAPCTTTGYMITLPTTGDQLNRFELLTRFRFRGNYRAAMAEIEYCHMNQQIPYIRVRTDYFKVTNKPDRYGINRMTIIPWRKEAIKDDHGSEIINAIHRFDDFAIVPDNTAHQSVHNNCYNLYAPFSHTPYQRAVDAAMIPHTLELLTRVFGDQINQALIYFKVLYEYPQQALPILCLVSPERSTGKTTVLNWMDMIFGDNFILINPDDLSGTFNSNYASKNIIAIDETVIDRLHAVEKLKSIATAKSISVNQKHVANYSIPFYGKVIICTNRERDFMKIDEEEIRFWVRRLSPIDKINARIEDGLRDEIPMFLKYLQQLPAPDFSRSRMVFTPDEIANEHLAVVKAESYSSLRKELHILIEDYFFSHESSELFLAASGDIKERWFSHDHRTSANYIGRVIEHEMKIKKGKQARYAPFDNDPMNKKLGKPFTFHRLDFVEASEPENEAVLPF